MPSADDISMSEATILPSQWADLFRPLSRSPEKRLMLAILLDALQCYGRDGATWSTKTDRTKKEKKTILRNEAEAWLFGKIPTLPWRISVEDCCATLDIDVATLRHALQTGPGIKVRRMHVVTIGSQHRMYKRLRRAA